MSKILTPKGWRDLIIEEKEVQTEDKHTAKAKNKKQSRKQQSKSPYTDADLEEPRVNNPFLVFTPSNREFISPGDKHREGFSTDVDFIHYHMGSNQKDHFDSDSEKVFPINQKKTYMVMSKYRSGEIEIMHHIRANSPLDAYNRYEHMAMNPGTVGSEASRDFRPYKKITSGYKVVAHKKGNIKDVYRIAKRTIPKL